VPLVEVRSLCRRIGQIFLFYRVFPANKTAVIFPAQGKSVYFSLVLSSYGAIGDGKTEKENNN
jgi:hypothetical protein